jgi:hypothetical protein
MTKKWIAINLLLLAIAGLLGRYVRSSIFDYDTKGKEGIPIAGDNKPGPVSLMPGPDEAKIYNAHEFAVVPEKFLFSESRDNKEPPTVDPKPPVTPEVVQQLTQKPILVGTIISDTKQLALIIDPSAGATIARSAAASAPGGPPGPPPQASRKAQVKRIGDTYQGYTITSITSESIVLTSGSRREIIPLHEGSKQQKGTGRTPIVTTRVVSIGGSGAGATGGTTSRGTSSAGSPGAGVNTGMPSGAPSTPGGRGGIATPTPAAPPTPAPAAAPAPPSGRPINVVGEAPAGGVIRTPFGDITRP